MKKGVLFPLMLVFLVLGVMLVLYARLNSLDIDKHNRITELLQTINQANASLNEDVYKVYAGVGRNYDAISYSGLILMKTIDELGNGSDGLASVNNTAVVDAMKNLRLQAEQKIRLVEEFKLRRAVLQNSLDHLPVIIEKVQKSQLYTNDKEHVLSLIRSVLFIAINGGEDWLNQARREYNYLEGLYQDELMLHLLGHAWLIIESSQKVHKIFVKESQAPLKVEINSLQYAYQNYHNSKVRDAERYRSTMFVAIAILICVIIYMLSMLSRNAIKLFRERERAQVTLSSISDSVIILNNDGGIEYLNPVAERMTGWEVKQAKNQNLTEVVHLLDVESLEGMDEKIADAIVQTVPVALQDPMLLKSRAGNDLSVEVMVTPLRDQRGEADGSLVVLHDVTQAQRMARRLEWQATHDALTGLVNRREFEQRVNEALITAHQDKATHTLMYLDLDQFKVVNDTCGHMAGDELLCQVTEQLKNTLRAADTLARLGGDEFGVLLRYCPQDNAEQVAEKLLQAIQDFSFYWEEKTFKIGVSIGLVLVTEYVEDLTSLLSAADVACYAAKDGGRNRVHVYKPTDEDLARREDEMHWVARINEALEHDRFVLFGQLIKPIQQDSDQGLYREVLIRLATDDGSLIPPGAFLPAAERYNLIGKVDRWVIENSFRFYAKHKKNTNLSIQLSINLSGSSVGDKDLHDYIEQKFEEHDVLPQDITFEITETAAITNLNQAVKMMRELRPLGCRFALDDFGAGLSSLGYLKNLPIDFIKIDGKFVVDIESDEVSRAMVEMINHVGSVMGLKVIAEFVENERVIEILSEIGVDFAQGYGVGVPHALEQSSDL